jgi:hypothetical protein
MNNKNFNVEVADVQDTPVEPIEPSKFDYEKFLDFEAKCSEKCRAFDEACEGVLVYRRCKVGRVYLDLCGDMELSLKLQLGALDRCTNYTSDVPAFLDPWYGVGTVASCFGFDYYWPQKQAPVIHGQFEKPEDILQKDITPVAKTTIGRHTIQMIKYFLEQTNFRLPVCCTDTQSSLDTAFQLFDTDTFFMNLIDCPDKMKKVFERIHNLLVNFTRQQVDLIDDNLACPGHGFPSLRRWKGLNMSNDLATMISNNQFEEMEKPFTQKFGSEFEGVAVHSCGNWSNKADLIASIPSLVMVDGAFSIETDPDPNPAEPFVKAFAHTGIPLSVRIVGDEQTVLDIAQKFCKPGLKVIITTYFEDPQLQSKVYDKIHNLWS